MTSVVDARTSQNASTANSIAIPILVVNTPQLFGQVGLTTDPNLTNMRVVLNGNVCVQLPLALVGITLTVVRGTLASDPVVYTATTTFSLSVLAPQLINFTAADYNPSPAAGVIVYMAFVSSNLLGAVRVGPESFTAIAFASNDPI